MMHSPFDLEHEKASRPFRDYFTPGCWLEDTGSNGEFSLHVMERCAGMDARIYIGIRKGA